MKPTNLRLHSSASRLTSRACGQTEMPSLSVLLTGLLTSPRVEPSEESRLLCVCDGARRGKAPPSKKRNARQEGRGKVGASGV